MATKSARPKDPMELSSIRESIPKEAFNKSLFWSLFYMFFDFGMIAGSSYGIWHLNQSGIYAGLPLWQQYGATVAHWLVSGFFMWGIFVVGHDCGHGSFSESTLINDTLGHLCHGSILVPYWPWRLSHSRHHAFHNHLEKDYSHPWYTEEKLKEPDEAAARLMESFPLARVVFPFIGWPLYLWGMPDGSHWIPWSGQRMWGDSTTSSTDKIQCVVSSLWVAANAYVIYTFFEGNWVDIAYYYGMPFMVFGWWLVCVTYLQHHDHDTIVYNKDWEFANAAFQTVDRTFGWPIDHLHHHITDGHVAHHLFYTKIPHYNLPVATKAVQKHLKTHDVKIYKHENTYDFAWRLHYYFYKFGFRATLSPGANSIKDSKKGK